MQGTHDQAGVPSSLEDRLRGMIISHQPHQSCDQNRSQSGHPLFQGSIPQLFPLNQAPPTDTPLHDQNAFHQTPPLPVPFSPQLNPVSTFNVPGPGVMQSPGTPEGGTPRFVPKHPPPGKNLRSTQPHGPRPGSRYLHHHDFVSSNAPPPPNLDHFPPLGREIPKENPGSFNSVPPPHADQPRGQHWRPDFGSGNQKLYNWRPPQAHYEQFYPEQAFYLDRFAKMLLEKIAPPELETTSKQELLKSLEQLCKQLSPTAKLVPFGSFVTGFATASSDIDCVFSPGIQNGGIEEDKSTDFPALLEKKLQEEGFDAQLLSRTRVPIIKMVQKPTPTCPEEIQCDIGFRNYLAVHNTQLLLSYSRCDARVKQMVLFVKWWAKKRHINSPYRGTLSSYGYVLMILHYLINIVQPPVLPNLQLQPVPENVDDSEVHHMEAENEYNIWFSKDIRGAMLHGNSNSIGELLRGFFDYYAYKFAWGQAVVSIRTKGGLLTKQDKDWVAAKTRPGNSADGSETWEVKDRYLFALEDPFETAHNVGRTCNGPGVGRIRDELRRAMMLIKIRGDRGKKLGECLCEEAPPERPFVRKKDGEQKDPNSPEDSAEKHSKGEETEIAQDTIQVAPNRGRSSDARSTSP